MTQELPQWHQQTKKVQGGRHMYICIPQSHHMAHAGGRGSINVSILKIYLWGNATKNFASLMCGAKVPGWICCAMGSSPKFTKQGKQRVRGGRASTSTDAPPARRQWCSRAGRVLVFTPSQHSPATCDTHHLAAWCWSDHDDESLWCEAVTVCIAGSPRPRLRWLMCHCITTGPCPDSWGWNANLTN